MIHCDCSTIASAVDTACTASPLTQLQLLPKKSYRVSHDVGLFRVVLEMSGSEQARHRCSGQGTACVSGVWEKNLASKAAQLSVLKWLRRTSYSWNVIPSLESRYVRTACTASILRSICFTTAVSAVTEESKPAAAAAMFATPALACNGRPEQGSTTNDNPGVGSPRMGDVRCRGSTPSNLGAWQLSGFGDPELGVVCRLLPKAFACPEMIRFGPDCLTQ